jgi:hypothetical protein
MRSTTLWPWLVVGLMAGCGETAPEATPGADVAVACEAAIESLSTCYPDLAEQATCNAESLAQFERIETEDCETIDGYGKADFFGFGCGADQRVCGYIFCCDPYTISWSPQREGDWDIVAAVEAFQADAPSDAVAAIEGASEAELREVVSENWLQEVAETPTSDTQPMAVHLTRGLYDVPYSSFVAQLAPEDWGISLAHYLGGEVQVYERDGAGRAVRQLERMVLSPLPFDYESPLSNNDMTKVEVIEYGPEHATVYWRVMYSDNGSTEADVGTVDFRAAPNGGTWVTFHSAHRLNAPGGIHVSNSLIRHALTMTFADFVRGYAAVVR